MTPEPADLPSLLRQQLLLAQVRIMELEDARDALGPRLKELEELLRQAQSLADRKLDETAHLGEVLAETRAHVDRLGELHRAATREISSLCEQLGLVEDRVRARDVTVTQLQNRLQQRDNELHLIKSSRTWRWTAWLRD